MLPLYPIMWWPHAKQGKQSPDRSDIYACCITAARFSSDLIPAHKHGAAERSTAFQKAMVKSQWRS
jgi:hypothetical protein